MITLAVDIGGTKISAALISDDGSFLLKNRYQHFMKDVLTK